MKKGAAPVVSIALVLAVVLGVGYLTNWTFGLSASPLGPQGPQDCQDPGTARTVTLKAIDSLYNPGTSIGHMPFFYRKSGETTWTDGQGYFSAVTGATDEVALGASTTTATTAEPQPIDGPVITYKVPCDASSTLEVKATNDALATDLTGNALEPNDGNVISASDPIDIDNGGPVSIAIDWYATHEEAFGTIACGPMSNIIVVKLNTTAYEEDETEMYYNGQKLTKTSVPTLMSETSSYKNIAFKSPVLKSTEGQGSYPFTLTVDPEDGAGYNPGGHIGGNVTLYMYDSHIYYDNNDNTFKCGVEDETGAEIGAASADSEEIYVTPGS